MALTNACAMPTRGEKSARMETVKATAARTIPMMANRKDGPTMIASGRENFEAGSWPIRAIGVVALVIAAGCTPACGAVVEHYDAGRDRYFLTPQGREIAFRENRRARPGAGRG